MADGLDVGVDEAVRVRRASGKLRFLKGFAVITIQEHGADHLVDIVVKDANMLALLQAAEKVAPYKAAVLITGETGTGKELIARIIHQHSNRRTKPWVDVNCAALPEHLVESELFGYEKGAFSGADSSKPGLFESAHRGTLFLDEIGELEPKVQVKLLRALDAVPYYRLGGNKKVSVDVRIVAATNRDLEAAVRAGTFRSDLYHRISEVHLRVPPLRDRPQDVVALAESFLAHSCPDVSFTPEALELLPQFEWAGNVRELRNLVLKLGILNLRREITAEDIRKHMRDNAQYEVPEPAFPSASISTMEDLERLMILRTLETTGGNQSLAARQLGIPRRTFCRKLNEHKITFGRRTPARAKSRLPLPMYFRAEFSAPVLLRTQDGGCFTADARNLSVGGLGLQNFRPPFEVSGELTLQFPLPGTGHHIEAKGIVVWSQPNAIAGIQFTEISSATSDLLRDWIATHGPASSPQPPVNHPLNGQAPSDYDHRSKQSQLVG
ncbi:MAG: sigma 54-interacting transcriptional regulator [Candidatus Korobacteraceae bacterium]